MRRLLALAAAFTALATLVACTPPAPAATATRDAAQTSPQQAPKPGGAATSPQPAPKAAATPTPAAPPKTAVTAAPKAPGTPAAATGQSFNDPFAYCRAVGTIDQPDARYTGPALTDAIITGLVRAFENNPTATPTAQQRQVFSTGTIWRCMEGALYACNVGANIPCASKANTSRSPAGTVMATFCQQNPNSDVIPGAAMDRASVFEWRCRNGQAEVVRQVTNVDAAGYPTSWWYRIGG